MQVTNTIPEPIGVDFESVDRWVYNRTGATTSIGDVVCFDLSASQAETTAATFTGDDGIFSNVIRPATNFLARGLYAVCLESKADNSKMKVRIKGRVQINVIGTNAAAVSEYLFPQNAADTLNSDASTTSKPLAMAIEASAGATEELIWTLFDGIDGVASPTA